MTAPPLVKDLHCLVCGTAFPHGNLLTCPSCGPAGILDVRYDDVRVRASVAGVRWMDRPDSIERYRELLPVSPGIPFPVPAVGRTPVFPAPRLAEAVGIRTLLLKDEGRNPTASFKDRASTIGVMKAQEFGFNTVACASTGNAASSLAGMAAATGLRCIIFVPERAPDPKLTQLLMFGATVFRVRGSYEDAFELSRRACAEFGWYNRNSGTNPFLVEGKKTAGLEIAEQCRESLPAWVVVSVGDGCTIGGIGKGLRTMKDLGMISSLPRLLGVQARGASPVVAAFLSGRDVVPSTPDTIADSIAVGTPRNWHRALLEVRASEGSMIAVDDEEILDAMRLTARLGGVFAEPAAAAGVAGLRCAVRKRVIDARSSALVVITGNGLKDTAAARKAAGGEHSIPPDLAAVRTALSLP